jgi:DNA-binding MarR family transcriptional regulator
LHVPLWRIAEELAVDQSTIVSTLTRLERDGYVRRQKHPEDRRSSLSTVTEAARRAHAEAQPSIDAAAREILGDIPDEELEAARRILVRIIGTAATADEKD